MKTFFAYSGVVFWCLVIIWAIGSFIAWIESEGRMSWQVNCKCGNIFLADYRACHCYGCGRKHRMKYLHKTKKVDPEARKEAR